MATMSFDDFPNLYTLTSATSRKVAQIQEHPIVDWMFSNRDLSFIVNLTGRAGIFLRDAETMKRVWQQIVDKSRAFFLGDSVDDRGFVVIHTKVEMIDYHPAEGAEICHRSRRDDEKYRHRGELHSLRAVATDVERNLAFGVQLEPFIFRARFGERSRVRYRA